MKRFVTALGMCALLAACASGYAYDWTGNAYNDDDWSTQTNWSPSSGFPDDYGDSATIDTTSGGWPVLYASYGIASLTVNNASATLDMNDYTLSVDGTAAIGNSGGSMGGTGGTIIAESWSITTSAEITLGEGVFQHGTVN
jgi:hypothetical protein